jgi:preprotein translocase subunit SecA
VAYKNEAFTLFEDLMHAIWSDFARMIYNVEVEIEGANGGGGVIPARPAGGSSTTGGRVSYSGGGPIGSAEAIAMAGAGIAEGEQAHDEAAAAAYESGGEDQELALAPVVEQRRVQESEQVGRNDPCWCGSGKKFKKCHGS